MTNDYINNRNFRQIKGIKSMGVGCIVTNHAKDKILLIKREDGRGWCVPGGDLPSGENPEVQAIREVKEETNVRVKIVRTIGAYLVEDKTGDPGFSIIYEAKYMAGKLKINHESTDVRWASVPLEKEYLPLAFGLEKAIIDWRNKK